MDVTGKNKFRRIPATVFLLIMGMLLLYGSNAAGQNQTAENDRNNTEQSAAVSAGQKQGAETTEGETSYLSEAGKFSVKNFDPTVWVLIFLFAFAISVSIERLWYMFRNRGRNAELVDFLTSGLEKYPDGVKDLAEKAKTKRYGVEGRIAAKTLEGWQFGRITMTEFSKAAIGAESRGLDKRLVILSTLGNNTPFIGLLGTVLGIMKAFRDLALAGDAGPAVVMKGISEALIATACGLAVAIPCVIAFNYFSKKVRNRLSNAQEIVDILIGIRSAVEQEAAGGINKISHDANINLEKNLNHQPELINQA